MRRLMLIALTTAISLVAAGSAQAVVVDINPSVAGQTTVPYNPANLADYAGVALVPDTCADLTATHPCNKLASAGIPTVTSSVSPCDPFLASDLSLLPSIGICSHGGAVMHANEMFVLTWDPGDPNRSYGSLTRGYMEQFVKDVADGSGAFTSPYAITSQYQDTGAAAANSSKYGGACIDYGNPGGSACQFGTTTGTGPGNNYPANGCAPSAGNRACLTDAQIQAELTTHLTNTQLLGHVVSGSTPMLVVLIPPTVEICLDSGGALCSANATSAAQFCSYHSQVNFGGTEVSYVVQPFTVNTACDEPNLPPPPSNPTPEQIAIYNGSRLVSPLSQAQIAAIVNPNLNGWFAADGSEINDNFGCVPGGVPYDAVAVGGSTQNPYYLQPEFNNAGVIDTDPSVRPCALGVTLAPNFVVPSAVEPGDVVQFDGSITPSTLIVPKANYIWDFGDGTPKATGPSVEHSFAKGGTYTVKLTVTDRGGDSASFSPAVNVLGVNGKPVTPPGTVPGTGTTLGHTALHAHLLLLPEGMQAMLRHGLSLRVSSNEAADGFVTLSISRGAAKRAHIRTGHSATVVVGHGTISGVTAGTVNMGVKLSEGMVKKLGNLRHLTLTVRLVLAGAGGDHVAIDAAGRY
ncbi:MAG: PKD domain-containing protein [Actinomycetota bacterium]|nr:PKD domain-containing protein [Actinomycetota bacterium]